MEETLGDTYQYRYIKQSRSKHVKLFGQKYTPVERTRLCTDYQKNSSLSFSILSFSAIIGVISQSVFSEPGYINQFFSITDWFPIFRLLSQVCQTYPVF